MSGNTNGSGQVLGASTIAAGVVALPFTGGSLIVTYIAVTAIVCGTIILSSKLIKQLASRFLA